MAVKSGQAKTSLTVKKTEEESGFFQRLRLLFPNRKKSQLAALLDVKPSAITPYITGRLPSIATLMRISELTGASIHWLLTGKGSTQVKEPHNQVGEKRADYGSESNSVSVYFGEAERRMIKMLAAEAQRTEEAQVRELVLERLMERLKRENQDLEK